MKWGDQLHFLAWKAICEKKEGNTMTDQELQRAWNKIETEEEKKKYWKCINGHKMCHDYTGDVYCSNDCENRWHRSTNILPNKSVHPSCLAGYRVCHNRMLQCPDCRKANFAQNRPLWKCRGV